MKTLSQIVIFSLAVVLVPTVASASLHVTPSDALAFGNEGPGNPAVEAAAAAALGISPTSAFTNTELYRIGNNGVEEKSLAGSYTGSITPATSGDSQYSEFSITYVGGPAIVPTYMLIKDGNNNPIWYVFDISSWDGVSKLSGSGFWPSNGSISHVSVYGTTGAVPEPGTIAIWGVLALSAVLGTRKWRQLA